MQICIIFQVRKRASRYKLKCVINIAVLMRLKLLNTQIFHYVNNGVTIVLLRKE